MCWQLRGECGGGGGGDGIKRGIVGGEVRKTRGEKEEYWTGVQVCIIVQ